MRAESDLNIPLGAIITDITGIKWVFVGWKRNSAGRFPYFVQSMDDQFVGGVLSWQYLVHNYTAAMTDTLIKKFPDIVKYKINA